MANLKRKKKEPVTVDSLPEEERKKYSRCCGKRLYVQLVRFHNDKPRVFAKVAACGGCARPCGDLIHLREGRDDYYLRNYGCQKTPEGFTSKTWQFMIRQSAEFSRYNCESNPEGVIVPFGYKPKNQRDFKAAQYSDQED